MRNAKIVASRELPRYRPTSECCLLRPRAHESRAASGHQPSVQSPKAQAVVPVCHPVTIPAGMPRHALAVLHQVVPMSSGLFDHGGQILIEHEAVLDQGDSGFAHHPEVLRPAPVTVLH